VRETGLKSLDDALKQPRQPKLQPSSLRDEALKNWWRHVKIRETTMAKAAQGKLPGVAV